MTVPRSKSQGNTPLPLTLTSASSMTDNFTIQTQAASSVPNAESSVTEENRVKNARRKALNAQVWVVFVFLTVSQGEGSRKDVPFRWHARDRNNGRVRIQSCLRARYNGRMSSRLVSLGQNAKLENSTPGGCQMCRKTSHLIQWMLAAPAKK